MYQRDLKIQKGIKNQIRFQFKNSDQKRIPISNTGTYVFTLFDIEQKLVLQEQLQVLDDGITTSTRGLALLTLTESDTLSLARNSYKFSVTYRDPSDNTYLPAYADTYYSMAGTAYVSEDVYPVVQPSQEVVSFLPSYNSATYLYEFKSGNVYAYPEYNNNTALHTVAMYMTNYHGTVYVEGSLSNQPDSYGKYATILTKTYNGFSGVDYANFNGVFTYIKIMHIPATAPGDSTNNNPAFYGAFNKVLYRS